VTSLRRQVLLVGLKLLDVLVGAASFALAALLTSEELGRADLREVLGWRLELGRFVLLLALPVAWHLVFRSFGLYRSRRLSSRESLVRDILKATSVGTLLISAAGHLSSVALVGPVFLLAFWSLSTGATLGVRLGLRWALGRVRRHGRNLRLLLIVGTNPRALRFARRIEERPELGYRVIGFATDEPREVEALGLPVATDLAGTASWLGRNVVDEVVIALPLSEYRERVAAIVSACEEQGIVTRLVSAILFELKLGRSRTEQFHDEGVITISTGAMEGWPVALKRVLDAAVAAALLLVLSPLFLAVAIGIRLGGPGPVFFVQPRVGRNKRLFRMVKFRTMVVGAETRQAELEHLNEAAGPVFKMTSDPRVTPLGRFLRRTSIDELPQLLNVLAGDMSLVGPRPLPVRDVDGFDQDWQRRRFSVRPGLTGLWQVSGRSSVPFERWMELDMRYIDQWSLWLDLRILAATIPAVLRGTGAA